MAAPVLDPNRYAFGIEAQETQARIDTEREILEITSVARARAQRSLDDVEEELRAQQKLVAFIEARREEHIAFLQTAEKRYQDQLAAVDAQRHLLHPLRKTPLEILALIFEECNPATKLNLWSKFKFRGDEIRNSQLQPFKLAAVCRHWRLASLNSTRCWSQIIFSLDDVRDDGKYEDMFKTFLDRSASSALTVTVSRMKSQRARHHSALELIKSALMRCVTLFFCATELPTDDMLHEALCSPVPKLVHAHISADSESDLTPSNFPWFPNATSLRYLSINSDFIKHFQPAPQLKSLAIWVPYYDMLANSVQTFPGIDSLSIMSPTDAGLPRIVPVVSCATVKRLRVDFTSSYDDAKSLWEEICAPRLYALILSGNCKNASSRISLARIIARDCELTEFNFSRLDCVDIDAFVELIHVMKHLKLLVIRQTTFTQIALQRLCRGLAHRSGMDRPWTNPKLVKVQFHQCQFDVECDAAELFNCASLRIEGALSQDEHRIPRLKQFHICPMSRKTLTPEIEEVKVKLDALLK